jgi:hypothetical protein
MINFAVKLDKTLDFLKSDVKSVKFKKIKTKNGEIKSIEFSEVSYSTNGDKILKCSFDDNNNRTFKQETIFKDGIKIGYINFDGNDNLLNEGEFKLDDSGKILSKAHDGKIEEEFKYDVTGRIIKVNYLNTGEKDTYEYDNNNLVIKQTNSYDNEMHFKNDNLGNVIEMKTYEISTGKLLMTEFSEINEYGHEIENVIVNESGNPIFKSIHEYEYDEKDNWISQNSKHSSGVSFEITREIDYFEIKNEMPTTHKSNDSNSVKPD